MRLLRNLLRLKAKSKSIKGLDLMFLDDNKLNKIDKILNYSKMPSNMNHGIEGQPNEGNHNNNDIPCVLTVGMLGGGTIGYDRPHSSIRGGGK